MSHEPNEYQTYPTVVTLTLEQYRILQREAELCNLTTDQMVSGWLARHLETIEASYLIFTTPALLRVLKASPIAPWITPDSYRGQVGQMLTADLTFDATPHIAPWTQVHVSQQEFKPFHWAVWLYDPINDQYIEQGKPEQPQRHPTLHQACQAIFDHYNGIRAPGPPAG